MKVHTMAQAKRDHEIGYLTRWRIERAPEGQEGWRVELGAGVGCGWLADARSKEPRVFKSLDGAVSSLQQIGFEVNLLCQGQD